MAAPTELERTLEELDSRIAEVMNALAVVQILGDVHPEPINEALAAALALSARARSSLSELAAERGEEPPSIRSTEDRNSVARRLDNAGERACLEKRLVLLAGALEDARVRARNPKVEDGYREMRNDAVAELRRIAAESPRALSGPADAPSWWQWAHEASASDVVRKDGFGLLSDLVEEIGPENLVVGETRPPEFRPSAAAVVATAARETTCPRPTSVVDDRGAPLHAPIGSEPAAPDAPPGTEAHQHSGSSTVDLPIGDAATASDAPSEPEERSHSGHVPTVDLPIGDAATASDALSGSEERSHSGHAQALKLDAPIALSGAGLSLGDAFDPNGLEEDHTGAVGGDTRGAPTPPPNDDTEELDAGTEEPDSSPLFLPEPLRGLAQFTLNRWVNAAGCSLKNAWMETPHFAPTLAEHQRSLLFAGRLGLANVLARTAARVGFEPPINRPALEGIADALGARPATGEDGPRTQRLLQACFTEGLVANESLRLELVLETLRPGPGYLAQRGHIAEFAERVIEDGSLREVLVSLMANHLHDPFQELERLASVHGAVSGEELTRREGAERRAFWEAFLAFRQAAGGRIKTTHCRAAWREFVDDIKTDAEALDPKRGPLPRAELDRLRGVLPRWQERHAHIADRAGAQRGDRRRMETTVSHFTQLADSALVAARAVMTHGGERVKSDSPALQAAVSRLLSTAEQLPDIGEELGRRALCAAAGRLSTTALIADHVPVTEFARFPGLLSALDAQAARERLDSDSRDVHIDLLDPRQATAAMLAPGRLETPSRDESWRALAVAVERQGRFDLEASLDWALDAPALAALTQRAELRRQTLFVRLAEVGRTLQALRGLGSPLQGGLGAWLAEAQGEVEARDLAPRIPHVDAWISETGGFAAEARAGLEAKLLARVRNEEDRAEFAALLSEGRHAVALHRFFGELPAQGTRVRQALYRDVARNRWPSARGEIDVLVRGSDGPDSLVGRWHQFAPGLQKLGEALVNRFLAVINRGIDATLSSTRTDPQGYVSRTLDSAGIREWLRVSDRNPVFLPQLARLGRINVLVGTRHAEEKTLPSALADALARQAATHAIAVALVPRMTDRLRDEVLRELRRRRVRASVLDDLDLLRVMGTGEDRPEPMIAFLEVVLEQLDWSDMSPFETGEGQHVVLEMFVGRKAAARKLIETQQFTRLFSGRKLGKSALLRFIQQTYGGQTLPSGRRLTVLYVPVAGRDEEDQVVSAILERLPDEFRHAGRSEARPSDRLGRALVEYTRKRPDEALLVVLDEADGFVEAQLEAFAADQERCLSFQMRSNLEAIGRDGNTWRIRFLFAGYRATQTVEGAWANWGDVLRLEPLEREEAARLVQGPLARLGIDAQDLAPVIAWQCGYQPAIILRFGRVLLETLRRDTARSERKRVIVTDSMVADVMARGGVEDEIRQVVRNNFQSDDAGWAVFLAMLAAMESRGSSVNLPAPAETVAAILAGHASGAQWLETSAGSVQRYVETRLREFERRALIYCGRNMLEASLRFPHHFPALLRIESGIDLALQRTMQELISRRLESGADRKSVARARSCLDKARRDELQFFLDPENSAVRIVAMGVQWGGTVAESLGVLDDLGIDHDYRVLHETATTARHLELEKMAVVGCTSEAATRVAAKRRKKSLLIGGADLLRWAYAEGERVGDEVQVVPLGRLELPALAWWFQRIRNWTFDHADAVRLIAEATCGIPWLVGRVDFLLGREASEDKSSAVLRAALGSVPTMIQEFAELLVRGPPDARLANREIALLLHVTRDVRELAGESAEMRDAWVDLLGAADLTTADFRYSHSDEPALRLLIDLGLLPERRDATSGRSVDRLARPSDGDPILAVVARINQPE